MATSTLLIQNFAQIEEVKLELGDLTVLVGPQGTGKSLALQWLKIALDGKQIVGALRDAGQDNQSALVDFIFGVGMGSAWRSDSSVRFEGKAVTPRSLARLGGTEGRVFFIPAHRSMLISDGWAAPFQKLSPETPVVARLFSQTLFDLFSGNKSDTLFPRNRVLKKVYRDLINDAVFHGGTVGIDEDKQHTKRLELTHGTAQLPFMTWTAGQREFTPLLLGLYHLLPPRKLLKQPGIDWVVIEEPEMGLHPQAISVFMLLVLDLLWRGYRVVLSTHSPLVLTAVWMRFGVCKSSTHDGPLFAKDSALPGRSRVRSRSSPRPRSPRACARTFSASPARRCARKTSRRSTRMTRTTTSPAGVG